MIVPVAEQAKPLEKPEVQFDFYKVLPAAGGEAWSHRKRLQERRIKIRVLHRALYFFAYLFRGLDVSYKGYRFLYSTVELKVQYAPSLLKLS
jgi:hypothetical protein